MSKEYEAWKEIEESFYSDIKSVLTKYNLEIHINYNLRYDDPDAYDELRFEGSDIPLANAEDIILEISSSYTEIDMFGKKKVFKLNEEDYAKSKWYFDPES